MRNIWNELGATRVMALFAGAIVLMVAIISLPTFATKGSITYKTIRDQAAALSEGRVRHLPVPEHMKAVYITGWAAGSDKFLSRLFGLIDKTEVNAVVIDIKDYSGRISFPVDDPYLSKIGASETRIPDVKGLVSKLHDKGIYVIGRISSFQDSYLINVHPEWAVKTKSGSVWADFKGVKWLDPGAKPVWDYLIAIGKQSYAYGFDELNFDYIRYPSDGNMEDISYSWSDGRNRETVMRQFFLYLRENLDSLGAQLSADLFGLTTSASGDLGIGQKLEDALPYFDSVYPMVYPSHFAKGFDGFPKPAERPYEVIQSSMKSAVAKAIAASSSPEKIKPWLQAFDLGAIYTPEMVHSQVKAVEESGLSGYLLWNAGSIYDERFLPAKKNN